MRLPQKFCRVEFNKEIVPMRLPTYPNLPQAFIQGPVFGCPGITT